MCRYGTFMMKSLCSANKNVNFVSRHDAFYRIMLSTFGRNVHDCLVYFDVSWGSLKMREWKMQEWKMREQIAGVENAGVENAGADCMGGKYRSNNA